MMKKLAVYDPTSGKIAVVITGPSLQRLINPAKYPGMLSLELDISMSIGPADTIVDGKLKKG